MMNNEKERLDNLLRANKITASDYKILLSAIEKKPSRAKLILLFLVNPFQKIAGIKALVLGMLIILIMSYLGLTAKMYFSSIVTVVSAAMIKSPKMPINFFLLLCQNLIAWTTLSLLFIAAAKILQPKKTRIIDFLGTVALARFPFLFFMLFVNILVLLHFDMNHIDLLYGAPEYNYSILPFLFYVICVVSMVWNVVTYFYAYKESSGLDGKKLFVSFIITMVLANTIAGFLVSLFM
jgi:hypothetical protein